MSAPRYSGGNLTHEGGFIIVSGKDCSFIDGYLGLFSNGDLGRHLESTGDLDGDGVSDFLVSSGYGVFVFSGKTGVRQLEFYSALGPEPISAAGDLNNDGIPEVLGQRIDYGFDPKIQSSNRFNILINDGKSNKVIGKLEENDFQEWSGNSAEELSFGVHVAGHPDFDYNGDGVSDFVILSHERFQQKRTYIFIVSGTCPVAPVVNGIPEDGDPVDSDGALFEIEPRLCGRQMGISSVQLKAEGQLYEFSDRFHEEDPSSWSDSIYSGIVAFSPGEHKIEFSASTSDTPPVSFNIVRTVNAYPNYQAGIAPYEWIPVQSSDQKLQLDSNGQSTLILPFPFQFYGKQRSKIYVNKTGLIGFQEFSEIIRGGEPFPNQKLNGAFIAPLYDLLTENGPNSGIFWGVRGTPGSRVLVLSWQDFQYGDDELKTGSLYNFQLVLYEGSNLIKVNYNSLTGAPSINQVSVYGGGHSGTVGVQGSPFIGSTFESGSLAIPDQTSIAFAPDGVNLPGNFNRDLPEGKSVRLRVRYKTKSETLKFSVNTYLDSPKSFVPLVNDGCEYHILYSPNKETVVQNRIKIFSAADGKMTQVLSPLPGLKKNKKKKRKAEVYFGVELVCRDKSTVSNIERLTDKKRARRRVGVKRFGKIFIRKFLKIFQ